MDITAKWIKTDNETGSIIERQDYAITGATYIVDGRHVVLRPSRQERRIGEMLAEKYGRRVELVPQILHPPGISTPDYLIDGQRFDLKTLTGKGKNLLYGAIAKKKKQAHNFIVDITDCPLSCEEMDRQIADLYRSPRVAFLETLVVVKSDTVVKVFARQ